MQTNVYANDCEICSKAADGKSMSAFPDTCWSPPAPPAGPVPIPYPNTAFARDLANGTRTVFICNTMVAQKDKSYLSTSTGDEPATMAFAKGIVTGALKGKAYFTSWSMNVKAEGLNVARHTDLMTHNHASPPGNTPPQVYFDDAGKAKAACANELKRIEKECAPEKDDPNDKMQGLRKARKGFLSKIKQRFQKMTDKLKKDKNFKGNPDNDWMEHCDGLWIKPSVKNFPQAMNDFAKEIEGIASDLSGVVSSVVKPLVDKLVRELGEKIAKEAAERGVKLAARAGARWAVGASGAAVAGVGAAVTETIATAWNIVDWASTAYDGYQLGKEIYANIDQIKAVLGDFESASNALKGIWEKAKSNPQAAMADVMGVLSRLNACTRARRCILVPYSRTSTAGSLGGKGCCPGQTGHHVIPDEMAKGNCPGYSHGAAPTICVEGVNNTHGTHGQIHRKMAKLVDDYKNSAWFGKYDTMSYGKARDTAINSVQQTFPESKCSEACLRAQLDAYYKNKCKGQLPAVSGLNAKDIDEDGGAQ